MSFDFNLSIDIGQITRRTQNLTNHTILTTEGRIALGTDGYQTTGNGKLEIYRLNIFWKFKNQKNTWSEFLSDISDMILVRIGVTTSFWLSSSRRDTPGRISISWSSLSTPWINEPPQTPPRNWSTYSIKMKKTILLSKCEFKFILKPNCFEITLFYPSKNSIMKQTNLWTGIVNVKWSNNNHFRVLSEITNRKGDVVGQVIT